MKNDFTNYSHCKEASPAFTLAEVLITLGIIGVVAAMTMPSLIAAHRKHEVVTKLEKIYSVFNQAVRTSTVEHGDVTSWGIDCGNSNNVKCTTDEALERFNEYIGKYLQITSITKKDDNSYTYEQVSCDDNINRFFPERYYLLPIPVDELQNNPLC